MLLDRYKHKIRTVEQVCTLVGQPPREKRVVLCHGVFDIVHPGHLRHLVYAKTQGDILIVSVTADRHIDKGIYRPHVPEELRALNVAALEFVDYVLIDPNDHPAANITAIRPDIYAKGFEYVGAVRGKEISEAPFVESYGGRVLYTPGDVVYSSTKLLSVAPPSLSIEKLQLIMRVHSLTFGRLYEILRLMKDCRVHVVGDTIVDSLTYATMIGGQTKTPTLSVKFERREDFVGGAAVVARHARATGAQVTFTTVLGGDKLGLYVIEQLERDKVAVNCEAEETRPTTNKNAIVVGGYRLIKLDTVDNRPVSDTTCDALAQYIRDTPADAVVLSDFRHGMFNAKTIPRLIAAIPQHVLRVADSQVASRWGNILEFTGFDLLAPNEREARFALGDQDSGVRPLATKLQERAACKHLLLKLGEHGLLAYDTHEFFALDSFSGQVVDPVGAGDALLAYATLALLVSKSIAAASILGSVAAALECETEGNVPVAPEMVAARLGILEEEQ